MNAPCIRRVKGTIAALPAVTLLLYLLLSEPPAVWLLFLGALAAHEWGHLCAFSLLGIPTRALRFSGAGLRLCPSLPLLPHEEIIVCLCGPLLNILFSLFALRFGKGSFFMLFSAVHFLFGLGNLLPFGNSDGERILRLALRRLFPFSHKKILSFLTSLFLAFFFYLSLFLYYLTGSGLCGVLFSVFFFCEQQMGDFNVF